MIIMDKLGLILAATLTCICCVIFLPPVVLYIIGCFQLGSWIAEFVYNRLEE
jgi:hypothetical protein